MTRAQWYDCKIFRLSEKTIAHVRNPTRADDTENIPCTLSYIFLYIQRASRENCFFSPPRLYNLILMVPGAYGPRGWEGWGCRIPRARGPVFRTPGVGLRTFSQWQLWPIAAYLCPLISPADLLCRYGPDPMQKRTNKIKRGKDTGVVAGEGRF